MESHTLPFFFFRRSSCVRKISRQQINPIIQSNCRNSVISSGCQLIHANFGLTLFLPKFHPRRSKEVLHTVTATPEAITESARIWTNWNVVEWKARLVLTHRTTNLQWAISHQSLKASASGERAEIRTKLTRYIRRWVTDWPRLIKISLKLVQVRKEGRPLMILVMICHYNRIECCCLITMTISGNWLDGSLAPEDFTD